MNFELVTRQTTDTLGFLAGLEPMYLLQPEDQNSGVHLRR